MLLKSDQIKLELKESLDTKDSVDKMAELVCKERDEQQIKYLKATTTIHRQSGIVKQNEHIQKELLQEIAGFKEEATKMRRVIISLEKCKEVLVHESEKNRAHKLDSLAHMKENDLILYISRRKIAELVKKLGEQVLTFEAVRMERNSCAKTHITEQEDGVRFTKAIRTMAFSISQMKEEIMMKNIDESNNKQVMARIMKEIEEMVAQMNKMKLTIQESVDTVNEKVLHID